MPNYAIQEQNQDMVSLLSAYFRLLYNPVHAFADAIGMLQMFPGIVGIWPGSVSGGGSGNQNMLVDVSGNALHLTRNGSPVFNAAQLRSIVSFNGSTDYYTHADAAIFDILGTETHIASTLRGLTIGAWIFPDNALPAATEQILTKGGTSAYLISRGTTGLMNLWISDGITPVQVASTSAVGTGWSFVCGRFDPSTEQKLWVNGTSYTNTTSIPASIANVADNFSIGANGVGSNFFDGSIALAFLAQAAIPDQFINAYFQMTAPLFGISV
jgi:hypothetical protein